MPFLVFRQDHLRSTLGIIFWFGIICGPIWGSFPVWGSFAVGDHLRHCTVFTRFSSASRARKSFEFSLFGQVALKEFACPGHFPVPGFQSAKTAAISWITRWLSWFLYYALNMNGASIVETSKIVLDALNIKLRLAQGSFSKKKSFWREANGRIYLTVSSQWYS